MINFVWYEDDKHCAKRVPITHLPKSTRINVRFCYCLIYSLISTIRERTKEKGSNWRSSKCFAGAVKRYKAEEGASYHPRLNVSAVVTFASCCNDKLKLSSINVDLFSPNNSKQLPLKINFNFVGKALHICLHCD